jgi:hypothetical protein
MHALDDPTTINAWLAQSRPINLARRPEPRRRDLRAAEGIILAVVVSVAVWAWAYVVVMAVW